VGSLSHHADIPGHCIGKISIKNQTSFVDVPEEVVSLLLAKKSAYRIGRRQIAIERA
jgi:ATP-dependent RNA helicase DeaD